MEGTHSLVKHYCAHRNVSADYVSLKLRWPEVEQRLHRDPLFFDTLAKRMGTVLTARQIVDALGLASHPGIAAAMNSMDFGCRYSLHALVNKVVRRLGLRSQFAGNSITAG